MALAAPLPTGAVTFAFTDIEGSTVRWESDRTAMQEAVRRHDAILRAVITEHRGYIFKTMGDAFCAAFTCPEDAVAAMAAAQQTLAAEDFSAVDGLRVRMALHTGMSDERDGDYFGPALNRVARLLAIAHGGQVLISGDTVASSQGDLPAQGSLRDLGFAQLKDLAAPEHVWQLDIAGLPSEFPPLRSLDALPNNLPLQRTTFVGREQDVGDVKELLGHHHLLTLVGSGGVGKTRLAIQVGADVLDRYPDGVWFVDLAAIGNPELVSSVVARTLGMNQRQEQRVDEAISEWLKSKKLLLIFDNCEHVLEPVAALAARILATARDVRIVATSRQALNISGEAVHTIPSLAVPTETAGLQADEALNYGAIALFFDRAKAANTRFALTDTTAPIVAQICRRLDGVALAIELAAARVKVLSISNLAERLNERFKLLSGGSRDALPRQRTLAALIDWSYDLLTPQEQMLFDRVGIFAGGFDMKAAAAVCDDLDRLGIEVLDLIASLTDKSLVLADTSGEHERFSLLESTRAYALERLTAAGALERLARRHAEYFRERAEEAGERFATQSTSASLAGMELELDNYRAVLEWALKDQHDLALGGAVAGALTSLWTHGGLAVEGRYWIGLAQAGLDESAHPRVAARLWRALSVLSSGKRARDCAQRALALSQSASDESGEAWALSLLAYSLFEMGHFEEADEFNARALVAFRAVGHKLGIAGCLNIQAAMQVDRGDAAARESFGQVLAAYRVLGDEPAVAGALGSLAELEFVDGRVEQALRLASEALEIQQRAKNTSRLAASHVNIAAYRIALGDVRGACEAAREGLRLARQAQHALMTAIALQHIALVFALRGEVNDAARLIGYVDVLFKEAGQGRQATERWGYERLMAALHERLGDAQIGKLAAEGALWSEDRAIEEAEKA